MLPRGLLGSKPASSCRAKAREGGRAATTRHRHRRPSPSPQPSWPRPDLHRLTRSWSVSSPTAAAYADDEARAPGWQWRQEDSSTTSTAFSELASTTAIAGRSTYITASHLETHTRFWFINNWNKHYSHAPRGAEGDSLTEAEGNNGSCHSLHREVIYLTSYTTACTKPVIPDVLHNGMH